MPARESLIFRIAKGIAQAPEQGMKASILATAGELYGARPPVEDATPPTGFDPAAAVLFEALVEGAFLVANADGEFDVAERVAFESVVHNATQRHVSPEQLSALVRGLRATLSQHGAHSRIQLLASRVEKPEHRAEVLRVSALIAQISGDVSEVERSTMVTLARAFALDESHVEQAISDARTVLASE